MTKKILFVVDGSNGNSLDVPGYQTESVFSLETAIRRIAETNGDYAGIVMKRQLDNPADLRMLQMIRGETNAPLVILEPSGSARIEGLEKGADLALPDNVELHEIPFHVMALRRRRHEIDSIPMYAYADLELHPRLRIARRAGQEIYLTGKEYELLFLFLKHPERILNRDDIREEIWPECARDSNIIEVYVRYLRRHTEFDGKLPRLIQTVRGVGYVLRETD